MSKLFTIEPVSLGTIATTSAQETTLGQCDSTAVVALKKRSKPFPDNDRLISASLSRLTVLLDATNASQPSMKTRTYSVRRSLEIYQRLN